jgi:hypothetical protein
MGNKELWNPFVPFGVIFITALFLGSFSWGGDFLDNDWGDSPADVEYYEGDTDPVIESGPYSDNKRFTSILRYYTTHLSVQAVVFFLFTPEEKLGKGFCVPEDDGISGFYLWEKALSDLYGEPENRDEILTDDESVLEIYYSGDALAIEEAVSKGYFSLVRYWENKRTYIWLAAEVGGISGRSVFVCVSYHSKEYFDLYRREEEKGKPPPRRGLPPWYNNPDE